MYLAHVLAKIEESCIFPPPMNEPPEPPEETKYAKSSTFWIILCIAAALLLYCLSPLLKELSELAHP